MHGLPFLSHADAAAQCSEICCTFSWSSVTVEFCIHGCLAVVAAVECSVLASTFVFSERSFHSYSSHNVRLGRYDSTLDFGS